MKNIYINDKKLDEVLQMMSGMNMCCDFCVVGADDCIAGKTQGSPYTFPDDLADCESIVKAWLLGNPK